MVLKEVVLLCFLQAFIKCLAAKPSDFVAPEVTLEAYKPKGFRASIPALNGIQMFAFHGNLNKEISQVDPGEFSGDFTEPTDGNVWSYYNDNLTLKVGDVIHYWTFIQYEKLGYRKDAQKWVVPELLKTDTTCRSSSSVVSKKAFICIGGVIFEDEFHDAKIDTSKWLVEEFIPANSQDFEFVSYQNKPEICYTQAGKLFIKPKALQNEDDVRGELDLRSSCTRQAPEECSIRQQAVFFLPPVTSGRMVSLVTFRYGKINIKAKLPAGDWIYPQIYLEEVSDPSRKLWIAYSRGNVHYKASNGEDIGGHLLFGGPVLDSTEPTRSTYLKSKYNTNEPFSSQMHTYTAIWTKDSISLQLDGKEYGKISKTEMSNIGFGENSLVRLVLGVGVGGINDFPDDFSTGDDATKKPWKNKERTQIKSFFQARDKWSKSWVGDNAALQIENIKITAL